MEYTPEEKQKLKNMMLFLIKRKHMFSGGHSGFHLMELRPIINEMVGDHQIAERPTIHGKKYFLNQKLEDNEN